MTEVGEALFTRRDPGSPFVIEFVSVSAEGEPVAHEHDEIGWFDRAALGGIELAPADAAFVAWLVSDL